MTNTPNFELPRRVYREVGNTGREILHLARLSIAGFVDTAVRPDPDDDTPYWPLPLLLVNGWQAGEPQLDSLSRGLVRRYYTVPPAANAGNELPAAELARLGTVKVIAASDYQPQAWIEFETASDPLEAPVYYFPVAVRYHHQLFADAVHSRLNGSA